MRASARGALLLSALLLGSCAGSRGSLPPEPPAVPRHPLFAFRAGFWVSLHHHLRGEARRLDLVKEGKLEPEPDPASLPPAERSAWEGALAIYARTMATRDLVFDPGMAEIKNALAGVGGAAHLPAADLPALPPEVRTALELAAPVYRARLWPEHERLARAWIAEMAPLVDRFGPAIAPRVAAANRTYWPAEPIPVEIVPEAGPNGAYTTSPPTRTSISSRDPGYRGLSGLEMLFHESSHAWGRALSESLAAEAKRQGVEIHRDLWHGVLFYTAGDHEAGARTRRRAGLRSLRRQEGPLAGRLAAVPRADRTRLARVAGRRSLLRNSRAGSGRGVHPTGRAAVMA
ncbi:MAG TPA: hypothetical protein VN783_15290 [Thermoanaerobaculia bacterium]|nr:hypothetical protein [Thermoanaerobaculia bacterium]